MKTFDSIRNIVTSQGDDYTTVCRLTIIISKTIII